MQVVAYRPLTIEALTDIAHQALAEVGERLHAQSIDWVVGQEVAAWIANALSKHPSSARAVRDLLRQHVVPKIARGVLMAQSGARPLGSVHMTIHEAQISLSFEPKLQAEGALKCA
jgi:type VI secretion system protein VasG